MQSQVNRTPDFIIIGAMKCATSTLHTQLASHPGIYGSDPKEPNYFSDDPQYARGLDWYSGLFSEAGASELLMESSTHYTKLPDYPETVARMRACVPEVKLIYVMRHPVDRLVSHYIHQWTQNVFRCGIGEALDAYPELINYGRYAYQLEPYLEAFGKNRILPVFFGPLRKNPDRELQRIARHIGYEGTLGWDDTLGAQNVSSERIRRFPGYELLVDSKPMEFLRRRWVPQSLRDAVKSRLRMKERPTLSDADRRRVEDVFDADLAILSGWMGVQLRCSNFDEVTREGSLDWAG
jgi:hypothetical protein